MEHIFISFFCFFWVLPGKIPRAERSGHPASGRSPSFRKEVHFVDLRHVILARKEKRGGPGGGVRGREGGTCMDSSSCVKLFEMGLEGVLREA